MTTTELVDEVSRILRNSHPGYDHRGDRIANASHYLRAVRDANPDIAKVIAFDLECHATTISDETGLPERRIFQISRVLFGTWCEL